MDRLKSELQTRRTTGGGPHQNKLRLASMNFKLLIQYDGTEFHGWQTQDGQRTVQGELMRVL